MNKTIFLGMTAFLMTQAIAAAPDASVTKKNPGKEMLNASLATIEETIGVAKETAAELKRNHETLERAKKKTGELNGTLDEGRATIRRMIKREDCSIQ